MPGLENIQDKKIKSPYRHVRYGLFCDNKKDNNPVKSFVGFNYNNEILNDDENSNPDSKMRLPGLRGYPATE